MKKQHGFTLVELVIVILILGILAAIAVPKMFNTSATAVDNGVKATLGTVRDAIELYAAKNGTLPAQGVDGGGNPTGDLKTDLEPYIRGPFPNCPVGNPTDPDGIKISTGTGVLTGTAQPADGWHYNSETGQFIINFNGATSSDATVTYDQF